MKNRLLMSILLVLLCLTSGCSDNGKMINPELHIINGTTLTITNRNSWDWENVSIILNPDGVVTSNFPEHGQYVLQYKGFLWETKKIKANQKMTLNLDCFIDGKGNHLAPGSLPSTILVNTQQPNGTSYTDGTSYSYQSDFHQYQ